MKITRLLFLTLLLPASMLAFNPGLSLAQIYEAVTKPSADLELSFVKAGVVAEVLVKEGDAVKEGQLLARLDDKVEQIQLSQLQGKAANKSRVDAAVADFAQKREDLKKIQGAKLKGAATEWELEHARLNVDIAKISENLARFEHKQDNLKYHEAQAEVQRMRLLSPINGLVEEVAIEPGESPQPLKMAVRVVKVDPLWIDVIVPLSLARSLKVGQVAYIIIPDQGSKGAEERAKGRITYVAAVSKAASDTLRVRLEMPNPNLRPAGERVAVSFSVPAAVPEK